MRTVTQLVTLFGAIVVLLLVCTEMTSANPLTLNSPAVQSRVPSFEVSSPMLAAQQSRSAMVQTLTCTNPTCSAQCRGRGYRRGSCTIGRCFCSYV
uniref:Invertebrate defensins family profile domain-containing protein n=1 Tax=Anopheles epiroticus TaxID=199890 RepID=A0A182PL75_9DIPT